MVERSSKSKLNHWWSEVSKRELVPTRVSVPDTCNVAVKASPHKIHLQVSNYTYFVKSFHIPE